MAKLPALVTEIARVDGRDRATVDHAARVVREAGHIPTGKRGGGASEMTSREAANILIALNGADSPKEGPLAIDRFRSLRQSAIVGRGSEMNRQLERYEDYPQPIKDVFDSRTFGEAFDALIEGAPDLFQALRDCAMATAPENPLIDFKFGLALHLYAVEVTFARYSAKIEMFSANGPVRRSEFQANFRPDEDRAKEGFYGRAESDRRVVVTIGLKTLMAAWFALHPNTQIAGLAGGDPS